MGLIPQPWEVQASNISPATNTGGGAVNTTAYVAPQTTSYQPNVSTSTTAIPMSGGYVAQPTSPTSVLSSQQGQTLVNDNTKTLQGIEQAYSGSSVTTNPTTGAKTLDQATYDANPLYLKPDETIDQYNTRIAALRNPTGSPAVQSMVDAVNQATSGGNLTQAEIDGLKQVQTTQDMIAQAAAKARLALESGNYQSLDQYTKEAQALQQKYADQLSAYFAQIAPLRQKSLDLLAPSAREQEIAKQLSDIRNQQQQFMLQTEEDKFNEYAGQTLGFAGGRAAAIDRRAEFKIMRMGLQESNLLSQLGLEQESRKMQQMSLEQQMKYISEDYDLQTKIQDRLAQMQEDLYQKAQNLQGTAQDTLSAILNSMEGIDPTTLKGASLQNLETLAARAGIPFDLVLQGLQAQYLANIAEKAKDPNKLIEVSPGNTLFDPTTGKEVYTAPGDSGSGFTLAPGSTRYDSEGNPIASAPARTSTSGSKYTATTIPNNVKSELISDIKSGASLEELFGAYQDVTTSYISSLYKTLGGETSNPFGDSGSPSSLLQTNSNQAIDFGAINFTSGFGTKIENPFL